MSVSPSATVGLGIAVFTIARLALFGLATTTVATAVLLVRPGTMFDAVAVAASAMFVPDAVAAFTCNTNVKLALALSASVAIVQVIVPVAPTAGVVQVQPAGVVMDWKVVFGGVL